MCSCNYEDSDDDRDPREAAWESEIAAAMQIEAEQAEKQRQDAATFRRAWAAANRKLNPTPEQQHLEALAFVAAFLDAERVRGLALPTSEPQLFVDACYAKRNQIGRALRLGECEVMRRATRALWDASLGLTLSLAAEALAA